MSSSNPTQPKPANEPELVQKMVSITGESESAAKSTVIYLDLLMRDYFPAESKERRATEESANEISPRAGTQE